MTRVNKLKDIEKFFKKRKDAGKNDVLSAISIALFLIFLPLANSISYLQNDEYTRYRLFQNFLNGKFDLDPYIGTTFYLQGFVGTLWAKIFGMDKMAILTLLVSVLSFYFFTKILKKHLKKSTVESLLIGGVLLLNPIFVYLSFGFMSDNYFLPFLILSTYFILEFDSSKKPKDFLIANLFIILGYFVRQLSLVTSVAFFVYLLFTKRYKYAFYQLLFLVGLWLFHYNIFPITPQMYDENIRLKILLKKERTLSLAYVLLIYLTAFTMPLVISFIRKRKRVVLAILLAIPLFLFLTKYFKPEKITYQTRTVEGKTYTSYGRGEFPYIDNVFGRKGYLQEAVIGDKYHYPGNFDLFNFWDLCSKILAPILIISILLNLKKSIDFFSIFTWGYMFLLLISPMLWDRYFLPPVLMGILMLAASIKRLGKLDKLLLGGFLTLNLFINYLYLSDFYLVNTYIWGEAERIVEETDKERHEINVNHGWRKLYPCERKGTNPRCYDYVFKYDPIEKQPRDVGYFEIIKEHKIEFPFNIYIDPKVYTYKRIIPVELDTR